MRLVEMMTEKLANRTLGVTLKIAQITLYRIINESWPGQTSSGNV
jgi:hypothetical protein